MVMSEFEIVKEFREAAKPTAQIAILADENLCTKKEIAEILLRNGCENVPKWYRPKDEAAKEPEAAASAPEPAETEEPARKRAMNALDLFKALSEIFDDPDDLAGVRVVSQRGQIRSFAVAGLFNGEGIDWYIKLEED